MIDRGDRRRVLVVEDEPHVARLFSSALEEAGYAVTETGDGASALDAVRTQPPDLVLLDLLLPVLNGWLCSAIVQVHERSIQGSLADTPRRRVLVVDDDPGVQHMLHEALSEGGYDVRTAANGAEALGVAQSWRPDLILLDLLMPTMNGWQFAEALGALPGPHAPIVAITAAGPGAIRSAEQLETISAVLPKPLRVDELLETVDHHLSRGEG